MLSRGARDYRPEVRVDGILARPLPLFTGNLLRSGRTWLVRPDNPLLPERLRLKTGQAPAASGVKILFRIETGPGRDSLPLAVLEEILGEGANAGLDPVVIAHEFGLPGRFSEEAEEEAGRRAAVQSDPEDGRRADYRGQFALTIDPEDARDFDDAVALVHLPDGAMDLYVHIADVSFYVPEGGVLDSEARERGTSVYFPGGVVPMLPEAISTAAASLSPESDKRVLTVRMRFDREGGRIERQVTRGWMASRARLHYSQAQMMLDGELDAPEALAQALRSMARLASLLRRRRFRSGGFDIAVPEVGMRLGPDGVPSRIFLRRILDTHRMIEEFMIAANLAVGDWAHERDVPFLFRVHEEPDPRALEEFQEIALSLTPGVPQSVLTEMPALRRLLAALPPGPMSRIVLRFFLRAMKKAVYSPVDLGHFGLGVRAYCHFTSPIRRYPDLFNHRRVKELLDGAPGSTSPPLTGAIARDTSRCEVRAMEAEREMIRLKSVRYMERRLGEELRGRVTGITPRGVFVELDAVPVDGFIPGDSLPAGTRFSREAFCWVVPRSGWSLRPGDSVVVQVQRCDVRARQIEFAFAQRDPKGSGRPGRAGRSRRDAGRSRKDGRKPRREAGRSRKDGRRASGQGRKSAAGGRRSGAAGKGRRRG